MHLGFHIYTCVYLSCRRKLAVIEDPNIPLHVYQIYPNLPQTYPNYPTLKNYPNLPPNLPQSTQLWKPTPIYPNLPQSTPIYSNQPQSTTIYYNLPQLPQSTPLWKPTPIYPKPKNPTPIYPKHRSNGTRRTKPWSIHLKRQKTMRKWTLRRHWTTLFINESSLFTDQQSKPSKCNKKKKKLIDLTVTTYK